MSIGSMLPLTVTLSMCLRFFWVTLVATSLNYPEMRIMDPNCLVAASNLEAMLTLGLKYEASILYSDPMAPSIAQPTCNPNPIFTE